MQQGKCMNEDEEGEILNPNECAQLEGTLIVPEGVHSTRAHLLSLKECTQLECNACHLRV